LTIGGYALVVGIFDWFAGNSTAPSIAALRWTGYCGFLALFAFLLIRAALFFFRRVNPYYVAHQLEQNEYRLIIRELAHKLRGKQSVSLLY